MPRRGKYKSDAPAVAPIKIPDRAPPKEPEIPLEDFALVTINQKEHKMTLDDLDDEGELGSGAYGTVNKMRHKATGFIMAVKRIRITLDPKENDRVLMDYHIAMKSLDCPYTVTFYGAMFREGDVWICMELMDRSLDIVCRSVYSRLNERIPETIVGSMAYAMLQALHYLKSKLEVMHRDVKPSNILINRRGEIKLCDFGISGKLVNSLAKTNIGCPPYLAPERINESAKLYDHRSDVWSYGITLYELGVGKYPYKLFANYYEQVAVVVDADAPRIPEDKEFSDSFRDFVHKCLTKSKEERARYEDLLAHDFIRSADPSPENVARWYSGVLARESLLPPLEPAATKQ